MLDFIDLINEHYTPKLYDVDTIRIEINFKNEFGDHEFSSTMNGEQFYTFRDNVARLYRLLTEQDEGTKHVGIKQTVG